MSSPGIVASGVRRSFGSVHAVRDVNLEARAGAVTGLVGPNGSGKTTLLLMLASLLAPDAGVLRIGGLDPVADPAGVRRIVGWMPDALGAWPSLTARETLVMTSRLYGIAPADAERGAARLLDELGLAELADTPARVFSRGQKQRLGLARALVHNPSVLLLDEPASGLDPQARIELRTLLRRLAGEGRTVLLSSHILSEVELLCDRVSIIRAGRIVESGTLAELRHLTRTEVSFEAADATALDGLADAHDAAFGDGRARFTVDSDAVASVLPVLASRDVRGLRIEPPSLEELFLRHYGDELEGARR